MLSILCTSTLEEASEAWEANYSRMDQVKFVDGGM